MTKFEQLMLRAMRAQLLLSIAQSSAGSVVRSATHDAVVDIENALTAGAIDERDEMHG